jgi:branched-chain amino acid aminotransferase
MTKRIEWEKLNFAYRDTGAYVTAAYRDGAWESVKSEQEPYLKLHIAATALHYGQACFEGLKAFQRADGTVALFRPEQNARRMSDSALRLAMEPPPEELFVEAVNQAVRINGDYVPPYGTGASLYVRPLLIGVSPHVGLHASEEYLLVVMAMPVGPYYKDGFFPVRAMVQERYDRAAPLGVGNIKAAGNYAAGLLGDMEIKQRGYPISLYLDSRSHRYVDEFGTSNFVAITSDGTYVTPESSSILPSITNKSLQAIARDFGLTVEQRPIAVDELEEFAEVGACGTAAILTPVCSIAHGDKEYTFGKCDQAGEMLTRLYREIQGIQYGEIEDRHHWMRVVAS